MSERAIRIQGAQEHNLQNISLAIPRDQLVVLTGVSGSGKSSLAFDTIYQEGQRRYVESLSAYARQFIGQAEKPRVDHIEGLSPTVAITQKTTNRNPRSTVGTITEIYDYLRVLFARLGTPYCPHCDIPIAAQTPDDILQQILQQAFGQEVMILAPIVRGRKGEHRAELEHLRVSGFVRAKIDGIIQRTEEPVTLNRNRKHNIAIIIDRLTIDNENRGRLGEAIEIALRESRGLVAVESEGAEQIFSTQLSCPQCGFAFSELEPRTFSFNTPQGCCPSCDGLGKQTQVILNRLITAPNRSINEGCIAEPALLAALKIMRLDIGEWQSILTAEGIPLTLPWQDLSPQQHRLVLEGIPKKRFEVNWSWTRSDGHAHASGRRLQAYSGVARALVSAVGTPWQHQASPFLSLQPCTACQGKRLRPESLAVRIDGKSIADVAALSIIEAQQWISHLHQHILTSNAQKIAHQLLREIALRLNFLDNVGLDYLTIDRSADTLSGGEAQRIRLATQVGSGLEGVTYVLDEPSIGLHHRDNERLLQTLKALRNRNNSVLVVEHDEETMRAADWIVDIGPGSGSEGGHVIAQGPPQTVAQAQHSLTGRYLAGAFRIPIPPHRRPGNGHWLTIVNASEHNLKHITVRIPLGSFTCITGVSGSGKSTLVDHILKRALAHKLHGAETPAGAHERIDGAEHLDKVIEIDQNPIGRTPRSNPATYTGAFTFIRDLFAKLPESRIRGYKPGRFSFNVKGGRCEACEGDGVQRIEMQFLADVEVPCEICNGKRFNRETLAVTYRGKTIADILDMRIDTATQFFEHIPTIQRILQRLVDVGLGYMQLGQSSTTLSGGEAQRVKLAAELGRPATGRTLYILDEPTTGLHIADVQSLLAVLQRLVDSGNTVLVIEHHPDIIKVADWIIDLGPEGGASGGYLVAEGTPEHVATVTSSYTGQMLNSLFTHEQRTCPPLNHTLAETNSAYTPLPPDHSPTPDTRSIQIVGARKHNLKNISVAIPKERLTVITGVSGSGKSTLALDTLFAEGQRRFVECLSAYARQFLGRMDSAEVEHVNGLAPTIAIDQRHSGRSPRSTVATQTEIYDYFRLLWARCGILHCPTCHIPLNKTTASSIVSTIMEMPKETITIYAPLPIPTSLPDLLQQLRREGFRRLQANGTIYDLEHLPTDLSPRDLLLVIDRMLVEPENHGRLADAVELALAKGNGMIFVQTAESTTVRFTEHIACSSCGFQIDAEPTPRDFSFNSISGACPSCHGLATLKGLPLAQIITQPTKSLQDGAIPFIDASWLRPGEWMHALLHSVATHYGFSLTTPLHHLDNHQTHALFYGSGTEEITVRLQRSSRNSQITAQRRITWEGIIPMLLRLYRDNPAGYAWLERYFSEVPCPDCAGERLQPLTRFVTFAGKRLPEVCRMSVSNASAFFNNIQLPPAQTKVAEQPLKEIRERLTFLENVGLGYLTLDRSPATLSGGEAQRVRLATQIGSKLVNVLYVLDEPTVGLHPRDINRLLDSLKTLRDLGNTVVLIEHDRETMECADYIIDLGPGAGTQGGQIVACGSYNQILHHPTSLTARYLRDELDDVLPRDRGDSPNALLLRGARAHNLKNIDVRFPLGRFIAVTGVSGSGKSSLVIGTLAPELEHLFRRNHLPTSNHSGLDGTDLIDDVIIIDQSPIGRTPRANPATFSGVFTAIRDFYAGLPEARVRGFTPARFSFNERQGMCSACRGEGYVSVEMHFLADVTVPCDVCKGRRFNSLTLEVKYRGLSIADVLELTVHEAKDFFANLPTAARILNVLEEVGLGYLQLGQPLTTLSRGESQRLKLATELTRLDTTRTVYILDEPTTGLHAADVQKLLACLQRLVDRGNTVIMIEHNMDAVRLADYVIDLGPEGGDAGGYLVASGPTDEVSTHPLSRTAPYVYAARVRLVQTCQQVS